MKSKVVNSDAPASKAKKVVIDPFESIAEDTPAPKPEKKRTVKPARSLAAPKEAKKVKKAASVNAFDVPADQFTPVELTPETVSSPVKKAKKAPTAAKKTKARAAAKTSVAAKETPAKAKAAAGKTTIEPSPVFKALAEPVLPELEPQNRARLLIQSPTKLYFYWSVKENPYRLLRDAFGSDTGSYVLVLKLSDVDRGTESVYPAEAAGEWWFDVEPDSEYQAEIGFYAVNRPYFRIIYSNTVETPRSSPSTKAAVDSGWTVSANKFAEVLDVSGFTQDAFDVAIAGDDNDAARQATIAAFASFTGARLGSLQALSADDMRHAMYALASGQRLAELRWQISPGLFEILQAGSTDLTPEKVMSALTDNFDIDESELATEQLGPAVFGASRVHFPRTLKSRTVRRYSPVSSPVSRA